MRKFKLPFVRRKDYEQLQVELRKARSGCESLRKENKALHKKVTQHKEKLEEETSRADHFQKRCEAYEEAAKRYALRFVRFEETEIFYLEKDLPSSVTAAP